MRRRLFGTRRRLTVTSLVCLLFVAGVAWGAWTVITSSGSGAAKTGQLTAPTIANGTTLIGDTYPSNPAGSFNATGTLTMTITNPNTVPLTLTGFTIDDDAVVGGDVTCDWSILRNTYLFVKGQTAAASSAAAAPQTGLTVTVPTGTSQVNVPGIIGLTSDTITGCQNQSISGFTITAANFSS